MIVEMKRFCIVCTADAGEAALESLREAGCAHLDLSGANSGRFRAAGAAFEANLRAVAAIRNAAAGKPPAPQGFDTIPSDADVCVQAPDFSVLRGEAFSAAAEAAGALRGRLAGAVARLEAAVAEYAPFGGFDPALARGLEGKGFKTVLARAPAGAECQVEAEIVRETGPSGTRFRHFAFVNPVLPLPPQFEIVPMPAEPPEAWAKRLEKARASLAAVTKALADQADRIPEIEELAPGLRDAAAFAAAEEKLGASGGLAWIEGWVPVDAVPALRARANNESWGLLLRPAEPGETPPTLVRPPAMFRPVTALFSALGISPAYTESDVSIPFFAYFTVFFAMLVGDGGYGLLTLLFTALAKIKLRSRFPFPWLVLLSVFGLATVGWGALSNTWFGASPEWLANPVSAWLDSNPGGQDENYHHIMLVCFTLGVSHLVAARLWNAVCVFPDRSFLAQIGWAGILVFMYWMTCSIVGIFPGVPDAMVATMCVSVALVFLFTLRASELKTRGIELGMLPLNIMSALGDIISYVRLFAVGLASVKVAQNFNDMATGLDMPVWLKVVPMALILLVGHALNFAMAGLAILVHAVRLNTLEFSNHKGITWAGYAYSPFRKH